MANEEYKGSGKRGGSTIKQTTAAKKRNVSGRRMGNGTYTKQEIEKNFDVVNTGSINGTLRQGDVIIPRGTRIFQDKKVMESVDITDKNTVTKIEAIRAVQGNIEYVHFKDGHRTNKQNVNGFFLRRK